MSGSIRVYLANELGSGESPGGAAAALGGNAVLPAGVHALGGPVHTGQLPIERISTTETDPTLVASPVGDGTVAFRPEATVGEITDIPTAETDTSLRLAPDGAGGVEWAVTAGGSPAADPGDIADPTMATAEDVALKLNALMAAMRTAGTLA